MGRSTGSVYLGILSLLLSLIFNNVLFKEPVSFSTIIDSPILL